jgi:hypothetical protein
LSGVNFWPKHGKTAVFLPPHEPDCGLWQTIESDDSK